MTAGSFRQGLANRLDRPAGRVAAIVAAFLVCAGPAILYYKPYDRIYVDPIGDYRLYSDDFAYIAASRTFPRTIKHLFTPHNTHISPTWRLTTWALIASAGKLSRIPDVLGIATYSMLVALMLLTGRLIARETKNSALGLASACMIGVTSLQFTAGTWYSAGQTLWAGFGIIGVLWYLQAWRRSPKVIYLIAAFVTTWIAGGFWSIGHASGPVGAVYLFCDGRPRCKKASIVPLLGSIAAAAVFLGLGAHQIDASISTSGRSAADATNPIVGIWHTLRAFPEHLILQNLGLEAAVGPIRGLIFTLAFFLIWAWTRRAALRPTALEAAGFTLIFLSYFVELSFRGYLPFSSLRGYVPWYDAIPHLGFVLLIAGWFAAVHPATFQKNAKIFTNKCLLFVIMLECSLLLIHRTRCDELFVKSLPYLTEPERKALPVLSLRRLRASYLLQDRATSQRRHLERYEKAEAIARKLGIGLDSIHKALGRGSIPEIPDAYDSFEMLDVPETGKQVDSAIVREALGSWLEYQPALEAIPLESFRPVNKR
jgi:hypothetical protein